LANIATDSRQRGATDKIAPITEDEIRTTFSRFTTSTSGKYRRALAKYTALELVKLRDFPTEVLICELERRLESRKPFLPPHLFAKLTENKQSDMLNLHSQIPLEANNEKTALLICLDIMFCKPGGKAMTSAKRGTLTLTAEESNALFGDELDFEC
jgi:hypothetical protein